MATTGDAPRLTKGYGEIKPLIDSFGPTEWRVIREKALAGFERVGLPTRRDEEFKYLPIEAALPAEMKTSYGATVFRSDLQLFRSEGHGLAFVNGQLTPELDVSSALPEGVFVGTLVDGAEALPEVVAQHHAKIATLEGKLGSTNDERFADLNTAFLSEGAFIYVPDGVELEMPIQIGFLSKADRGAFAAYPRVLIVLGKNASAVVDETYEGLGGGYFTNAVTEIYLDQDARLTYTKTQSETPDAVHVSNVAVFQEAGSTFTSNAINFGASLTRNDINVWLNGEHTETWLNGASLGLGKQVIDNHTRIDHAMPNCHSFENYKAVHGGESTGVFNGKIFVYEDAQKTDAKQTNNAMLLSATAQMNTKPQLEIFADDVKCTHGATIGQVSDESLFYLRARGIPKEEARSLLVYAFLAEVLDKVPVASLKEALEARLYLLLAG